MSVDVVTEEVSFLLLFLLLLARALSLSPLSLPCSCSPVQLALFSLLFCSEALKEPKEEVLQALLGININVGSLVEDDKDIANTVRSSNLPSNWSSVVMQSGSVGGGGGVAGGGRMLKQLILGKGHQPSADRIRMQKELFGFQQVRMRAGFPALTWPCTRDSREELPSPSQTPVRGLLKPWGCLVTIRPLHISFYDMKIANVSVGGGSCVAFCYLVHVSSPARAIAA